MAVALLAVAASCAKLPKSASLMPATAVGEHVALEVFFVRVPAGDQTVLESLWPDVDEQVIPLDVRRRLSANGLMVGQIGGQLPAAVTDLLKVRDDAPTLDASKPTSVDLTKPTILHRKRIDVYQPETPNQIVVTGERERHEKLVVLFCDEEDGNPVVRGETFKAVQGRLLTKVHPQPDGRVKLDIVPEIEHGDPVRKFSAQDGGVLTVQFAPQCKTFDGLRVAVDLSPGEMLVFSCQRDRPGSLGQQFFTERQSDVLNQIVLMIRVVQAQGADLFADSPRDK
jgi:hypothetical protein